MSRDMLDRFDIAAGTVTGRSHTLSGRPNQDALSVRAERDLLCAVVCDGCGSGAHSEVGATLGARLLTAAVLRKLLAGAPLDAPSLWDEVRRDVLDALRPAALAAGGRLSDTVSEMLLFTVVGVAMRGDRGALFAAGDGVIARDGALTRLGPFPGDAPPYLGYGLFDGPHAPGITVIDTFSTADVETLLVGTDGAAALADLDGGRALARLWEEDRHFKNRDGLRRTLALMNREEAKPIWAEQRMERRRGLLEDDATVVVLRKRR